MRTCFTHVAPLCGGVAPTGWVQRFGIDISFHRGGEDNRDRDPTHGSLDYRRRLLLSMTILGYTRVANQDVVMVSVRVLFSLDYTLSKTYAQ